MDDREQLRLRFNHAFARWGIELPPMPCRAVRSGLSSRKDGLSGRAWISVQRMAGNTLTTMLCTA